jgi:hypothetical protein
MRLLVFELWRLGDLALAAPFFRLASESYEVTLVAKPLTQELRPRFWPRVRVVPFVPPWTVFPRQVPAAPMAVEDHGKRTPNP